MRIDFVDDGRGIRAAIRRLSHTWFVGADGGTESVLVGDVLDHAEDSQWISVTTPTDGSQDRSDSQGVCHRQVRWGDKRVKWNERPFMEHMSHECRSFCSPQVTQESAYL